MASYVTEKYDGQQGSTDENGTRILHRKWTVKVDLDDLPFSGPEAVDSVIAVDPSAALFEPCPDWPQAVCRRLDYDRKSQGLYEVVAEYSTAQIKGQGDGNSGAGGLGSPTLAQQSQDTPAEQRLPQFTMGKRDVTEPYEYDVNGLMSRNTLGDPFVPAPERESLHDTFTWRFYRPFSKLNWAIRSQFKNSVNKDVITILGKPYAPHTLRCTDYALELVWETTATGLEMLFLLTVTVEHNPAVRFQLLREVVAKVPTVPLGWDQQILNTSKRKWVSGSLHDPGNPPKLADITDVNGLPVSDPVPITRDGVVLGPGDDLDPAGNVVIGDEPAYLLRQPYVEQTWLGHNATLTGVGGLLGSS